MTPDLYPASFILVPTPLVFETEVAVPRTSYVNQLICRSDTWNTLPGASLLEIVAIESHLGIGEGIRVVTSFQNLLNICLVIRRKRRRRDVFLKNTGHSIHLCASNDKYCRSVFAGGDDRSISHKTKSRSISRMETDQIIDC
ncbi:hypothetical protein TNCV_849401 [Trichonephila clavipes]|uniref:Uncharacterized protein n=1 Tax=Trichonephila clavipes TaxID=2585209 RepID=A0A8X6RJK1_TRICX|nr:hypothetical protein TNCV_849401 [Trichonephila clavipes]